MSVVFVVLAIAWFAAAIWMRASALVGKDGRVHRATRLERQSIAYRKRLERAVHSHS